MKITKYIKLSFKETVQKINGLDQIINNTGTGLMGFSLTITMYDKEICFEDKDEMLSNYSDIDYNLINKIALSMHHESNDSKIDTMLIHCGDYLNITFRNKDKSVLDSLFLSAEKLFLPKKFYKFIKKIINNHAVEVNKCIKILNQVDNAQTRKLKTIDEEKDFQKFLYPILKVLFPNLLDEFYLPKFGNISYRPDFGIKELGLLIEAKFIRENKDLSKIQKELHDDIIGYLNASDVYKKIIFVLYNKQNIAIQNNFINDLKKVKNVRDVIVCKGIS